MSAEPGDPGEEQIAQVIRHTRCTCSFCGKNLLYKQWDATTTPVDAFGGLDRRRRTHDASDLCGDIIRRKGVQSHTHVRVTMQHL